MAKVLDYYKSHPEAAAIAEAGYAGAARYIGFPWNPKCTTSGELADFKAHGLSMSLVFEHTIVAWRRGFQGGVEDAGLARGHADNIGWPRDRPISMAIDQDVVLSGEFDTMIEYLRGANGPLGGPGLTGVYGEADVIDRARDAGVASWFWQSSAWSRGRRTTAHLFQHVGTVWVGGVACDFSDVLTDDWGQYPLGDKAMTPKEMQDLADVILGRVVAREGTYGKDGGDGTMNLHAMLGWWPDRTEGGIVEPVLAELTAVRSELAEVRALLAKLTSPGVRLVANGSITVGPDTAPQA